MIVLLIAYTLIVAFNGVHANMTGITNPNIINSHQCNRDGICETNNLKTSFNAYIGTQTTQFPLNASGNLGVANALRVGGRSYFAQPIGIGIEPSTFGTELTIQDKSFGTNTIAVQNLNNRDSFRIGVTTGGWGRAQILDNNWNVRTELTGENSFFMGRVGIGTQNPQARLHIYDSNWSTYQNTRLIIETDTIYVPEIEFRQQGQSARIGGGSNFVVTIAGTPQFIIEEDGSLWSKNLQNPGNGTAYACISEDGHLFRSSEPCA